MIQISSVHYQVAQTWIQRFDTVLRTLDALHLAIANEAGLTVITGDSGLAQSAQTLGLDASLIAP